LARAQTSGRLTHNCWLSNDGNYLITTDEIQSGAVDIYDVSNLNNVQKLDSYKSNPRDSATPHNTFFFDDFIFTAYYRDGVTLVDATKKDNLVEVGNYDTSPLQGPGFEGAWGVYPYLPSGNILVTDREEGLFVLSPQFKRASYLEGNVTNSLNGFPVNGMQVELMNTKYLKRTIFNGNYKTGAADEGFYDVRFYHPNCKTVIVSNVELIEGQVTLLDIQTECDFTVSVFNQSNQNSFKFYPNPTNSSLYFDNNLDVKILKINIFDISGRQVVVSFNSNNNITEFNVSNLLPGIYIVNIATENEFISHKFIKN
jgi:hypothetical protein